MIPPGQSSIGRAVSQQRSVSPHRPPDADPSEDYRSLLLNTEQVAYLELAAQGLDFLAELEEQIDKGNALDVAWDVDPAATRETAAELRAIASGWKAKGGLFAVTEPAEAPRDRVTP